MRCWVLTLSVGNPVSLLMLCMQIKASFLLSLKFIVYIWALPFPDTEQHLERAVPWRVFQFFLSECVHFSLQVKNVICPVHFSRLCCWSSAARCKGWLPVHISSLDFADANCHCEALLSTVPVSRVVCNLLLFLALKSEKKCRKKMSPGILQVLTLFLQHLVLHSLY